jgi:hypothetical protein
MPEPSRIETRRRRRDGREPSPDRVLVGALFVGHGTQKLFGAFGGEGPDGTGSTFESVGLKPGRANAVAASPADR